MAFSEPQEERTNARAALKRCLDGLREKSKSDRDSRHIAFYSRVVEDLLALEELHFQGSPKSGDPLPSWRDLRMADNILWMANDWYREKKIIVWAASLRTARNLGAIETQTGVYQGYTTMGTFVRNSGMPCIRLASPHIREPLAIHGCGR